MEKIKIDLDIILPDVPDEKDACVHRIISSMEIKKGIEKVHIVPETETTKAKLCFHYNPGEISIEQVQKLAVQSGAEITERFGHLLLEVKGIRYVRHARVIEFGLKDIKGILSVSVSATGWINIEFDLSWVFQPDNFAVELLPQLINLDFCRLVATREPDANYIISFVLRASDIRNQ